MVQVNCIELYNVWQFNYHSSSVSLMTKMNTRDQQKLGPENGRIQVQSWPEMHLKFIWGNVAFVQTGKNILMWTPWDIHNLSFVHEFHKNIQQEKCSIVWKFKEKSQSAHWHTPIYRDKTMYSKLEKYMFLPYHCPKDEPKLQVRNDDEPTTWFWGVPSAAPLVPLVVAYS